MKKIILIFGTIFALVTFAYIAKGILLAKSNLDSDKLLEIIQEWRTSNNLPKYAIDQKMCDIASTRISDIQNDFSHSLFIPTVQKYFGNQSYKIAENLGKTDGNEHSLLNDWLNSPEHKENLVSKYQYTCIKVVNTPRFAFAVQIFGNY